MLAVGGLPVFNVVVVRKGNIIIKAMYGNNVDIW